MDNIIGSVDEVLGRKPEEAPLEEQLKSAREEADSYHDDKEAAEDALLREYHYHMLRAEELREFLRQRGHSFPGFD